MQVLGWMNFVAKVDTAFCEGVEDRPPSAAEFGKAARVPVTWLVAANDSYFSPDLSRQLADAFRERGGKVEFRVLAASGSEGHWLVETEAGIKSARLELDRALKLPASTQAKKR